MGTQNLSLRKTQFDFMFRKMIFLIKFLWVLSLSSLFTLFGPLKPYVSRFQRKFISQKRSMNFQPIQSSEEVHTQGNVIEEVEEESESFLRFNFTTYEEFIQNNAPHSVNDSVSCKKSNDKSHILEDEGESVSPRNDRIAKLDDIYASSGSVVSQTDAPVSCTGTLHFETEGDIVSSRYETIVKAGDILSRVEEIVEPHIRSESILSVKDATVCSTETCHLLEKVAEERLDMSPETKLCQRDVISDFVGDVGKDSENMEVASVESTTEFVDNSSSCAGIVRHRTHLFSDDESLVSDSDTDSMVSSSESSFRSSFIDSLSDGFMADIDFERAFEFDVSKEFGWKEVNSGYEALTEEDIELLNLNKGYGSDDLEMEDEDIIEELRNIQSDIINESATTDANAEKELLSEHNANVPYSENEATAHSEEHKFESNLVDIDDAERENNLETGAESEQNAEKTSSEEQLLSDSEEQNGLEKEWEHQDLLEQLKMEIKKVRSIGLPTILEESESPKIMDDLKPWKIEEKYQHEGTFDEMHKFYKSYRERMRKLDILNYQKMYAIGFLKLKDPLQSFTKNKLSTSALATIVSIDCWPCKPKSSSEIHQPVMKKFTKELESDLEMVYVSQTCLSWEFLRWEYGKALDLWESDPHGVRRYNEVAEKFQTFQVLLTRFLEDEPFQGPRVQYYVKNRCLYRNFLQVPVIRDDEYKDRKKETKMVSSRDAITSLQLVETMEESIRILWQFIRSDKETSIPGLLKCRRSANVEFLKPADASLLEEVRSTLHKKDKKLKEVTRSESCVLRNFRKHQEDGSDHVLYFFSRVDLKLVSRVLKMSRITTEQLVWCSEKLSQINFEGRKLLVEPSVLLFPCS